VPPGKRFGDFRSAFFAAAAKIEILLTA